LHEGILSVLHHQAEAPCSRLKIQANRAHNKGQAFKGKLIAGELGRMASNK